MNAAARSARLLALPGAATVLLPGLLVAGAVAAAARGIARFLPSAVSEVLVAVLLGLVVANVVSLPSASKSGVRFAVQRVLRLGIILLGARLSLVDVARIGLGAFGLVLLCMTGALTVAWFAGRMLRVPPRLALLIGVGTAVCGNSAIVATAPVVKAEEREVSFAVGTITLFGTLAVFLYPLIGHALGLAAPTFGVWSGVAVNDTSQVIATSAAYAPEARDVAAVVKLVRNTLMAPLLLLIAWWWGRRTQRRTRTQGLKGLKKASASTDAAAKGARGAFPLFVLGFLAVALLRTVGLIDRPAAALLDEGARLCILVALAGVGLSTRLGEMRRVGLVPFALGLSVAAMLATLSLLLVLTVGPAA